MGYIRNDNFIHIGGFMVNELHLKGNELIVYAIIYGFTQAENQMFNGSLKYLAEWTGATKQGVIKNLKSLLDKGLIQRNSRIINGVNSVEYYATQFNGVLNSVDRGIKHSLTGGIKLSLPNNINMDNIEDNIEKKSVRHKYGEYLNVLLTDEEFETWKKECPLWSNYIEKLSGYMKSSGKSYKSHLATLRNWYRRDKEKAESEVTHQSYDLDKVKQEAVSPLVYRRTK